MEEPLIETSAELFIELMPSLPTVRVPVSLRSHNLYDPLQIFLEKTESQEIRLFMVRSTVDSVLTRENVNMSAHVHCLSYHLLKQIYHGCQFHLHPLVLP